MPKREFDQKFDPKKTSRLAELRDRAGLTQDQAAECFGLKGESRRNAVGKWEGGHGAPAKRRRPKLISCLWDRYRLRRDPELFKEVWDEIFVEEWGFSPLRLEECPAGFPSELIDPEGRPRPFLVPPNLLYFVGRQSELAELKRRLLDDGDAWLVIQGMGGIGKTSLATRFAYDTQHQFPDGVLWATLGKETTDVGHILAEFAREYGIDASKYPDIDTLSQVVRGILARKTALIILDNAVNSHEIKPLLPPTTGSCFVLITTRFEIPSAVWGAEQLILGPFDKKGIDSLSLYEQLSRRKPDLKERGTLQAIARLLEQHPLAVAIAFGRLVYEPGLSPDDFLERIRDEHLRLDELAYQDTSIRSSFNLSYSRLSEPEQRFFISLAVFEGRDFEESAAAAVANTSKSEAGRFLRKLFRLFLVEQAQNSRFRLHRLINDFVSDKTRTEGTIDYQETRRRFVKYFVDYAVRQQHEQS
jgi:transcriptional regulator with XRE-family HTH domain